MFRDVLLTVNLYCMPIVCAIVFFQEEIFTIPIYKPLTEVTTRIARFNNNETETTRNSHDVTVCGSRSQCVSVTEMMVSVLSGCGTSTSTEESGRVCQL